MKDQSFYIAWLLVAGAATAAAVKDAEAGDREYAPVLSQRFLGISGSTLQDGPLDYSRFMSRFL